MRRLVNAAFNITLFEMGFQMLDSTSEPNWRMGTHAKVKTGFNLEYTHEQVVFDIIVISMIIQSFYVFQ